MEVHFTPEQEAQLSRIASHNGTEAEQVVQATINRMLENQSRFLAGVQRASPPHSAVNLWSLRKSGPMSKRYCSPNATAMDGTRSPGTFTASLDTSGAIIPTAAREVAKAIYDGCESLVNSPYSGRKGKQSGTRELVLSPLPYVAVYRVMEDVVEILHIGARDR